MRILLNWYYHRKDLTEPILEAFRDHELYFVDRQFDDGMGIPGTHTIYWGDYKSPYAILDSIRPDRVIFSDIESFPQLALNIAAKNRGIETYVVQHGTRGAFELEWAPSGQQSIQFSKTSAWTALFLLRSFRPRNISFLSKLARFVTARKRYELTTALRRNHFDLRLADHYIEFSALNASYHRERDGVPEERFQFIGNPALDNFFRRVNLFEPTDYALLIDAPFAESGLSSAFSADQKADYLSNLQKIAERFGLKLVVKLHPLSYGNEMPQLPNTTYVRDGDLAKLVGQSKMTFSVYYSSLSAAILHMRPFIPFALTSEMAIPFLDDAGISSYELLHCKPETVGTPRPPLDWAVVEDLLHASDGLATKRLRTAVLGSA